MGGKEDKRTRIPNMLEQLDISRFLAVGVGGCFLYPARGRHMISIQGEHLRTRDQLLAWLHLFSARVKQSISGTEILSLDGNSESGA